MKRTIIRVAIVALFLFIMPILSLPLIGRLLYISSTPHKADTIIVLSGDSEPYYPRTEEAIKLFKQGYAPYIIFTGYGFGGDSAEFLSKIALHFKIPKNAILIEPHAQNTYENFLFSKPIILKHGFQSILIVTSPYHQLRAYLVAKKIFKGTGIKIYNCASSKPESIHYAVYERIREGRFELMECIKILGYYMLGRI